MSTENQTTGMSFLRRRGSRVALGAASVAGFTLIGAVPAFAATDADCTSGPTGNTVDALAGGTAANIQTLLDADTSVICISGTFVLTTPLTFDHTLTLYGLSDGVLDGNDATQILTGSSAPLTVQNLTFQNGSSNYGGAIAAELVTVIDSRFEGNGALLGGAVAADEVDVEGSTFVGNTSFLGGAIYAYGQVEVGTSTFTENISEEAGGAIFTYNFLGVDSSTFEANSAGSVGGALYVEDVISVENSTFVGNMVEDEEGEGGALVASYGTVLQSTFVENSADLGNSISASNTEIELKGNVFVNESTEPQLEGDEGSFTDLGGNVFSTASESALADVQASTLFSRSVEAVFAGATLAENGGPTETVALYAGSPAIDLVPSGEPSVSVDQRGVARDSKSDSGAYEFAATVVPVVPKPALAATGSTTDGWIAGAGGILLAVGGLALAAVRRRRASDI